jgi:hypothetical protein
MKQHNARYGFVLTDTELVLIKRLDADGNLLVARDIPCEVREPGRLTILLGLWYLGMLAAADDDWHLTKYTAVPVHCPELEHSFSICFLSSSSNTLCSVEDFAPDLLPVKYVSGKEVKHRQS